MTSNDIQVRQLRPDDVPSVLGLMRELAEFEGYLGDFAVTENALRQRALGDTREVTVLVAIRASQPNQLLGMAVTYVVPFTFTLQPELVLKELYVEDDARNLGIGKLLMQRVVSLATERRCYRVRWLVLKDNHRARDFYRAYGAAPELQWENWQLQVLTE